MSIDNPYNPPQASVADITTKGGLVRHQIRRLSPHQNAKVSAVMMAIVSLVFILPFGLIASAFGPSGSGIGMGMLIAAPLIYLVVGYVMTIIGCAVYNFVSKLVGGIEYEAEAS
ncbi:MAG: hypothetical protein KF891_25440 [Rhizobacter sp.]|nr:hypothetical protein [Rhizobacter sp.]